MLKREGHTDADRPTEREREGWREGADVHTQLQKTDDVGACCIAADLSCVLVAISCLVQHSMFVSKGVPSIPILGCLPPCECLI